MSKTTVPAVNKAIRERGIDAELVRGRGYFYFIGKAVDHAFSASVMTNRVDTMTVEEWLGELDRMVEQQRIRRYWERMKTEASHD